MAESRIKRALEQPMYLISCTYNLPNNWFFTIQGYSGIDYNLIANPTEISCNCPDFKKRSKEKNNLCKHLYFIFYRIANAQRTSENIFQSNPDFSENLMKKLKTRIDNIDVNYNYDVDDCANDCVICFETVANKESNFSCCLCKNIFHKNCINRWIKINNTCPLCRMKIPTTHVTNDILEYFQTFVIG